MEEKKKVQKKNKPKFSFYLVSFLLVFCIVGSLLGTIAFFQNNFGTKKVKADEPTEIIEYDNLVSFYPAYIHSPMVLVNSNSIYTTSPLVGSYFQISADISLKPNTNYTAYSTVFGNTGVHFLVQLSSPNLGNYTVEFRNSSIVSFNTGERSICRIYLGSDSQSLFSGSLFLWEGTWSLNNITDSMKYQIGYSQGVLDTYQNAYDEGYNYGVNNISTSLGVFQNAEFRYIYYDSAYKVDTSNNYSTFVSDYTLLPSNLNVLGYYQGVNFVWQGQNSTATVVDGFPYTLAPSENNCVIRAFFRQPFLVSQYSVFNVNILQEGVWYTSADFGTSLIFYFTDGSYKRFNQFDGYFSFVDLSDNITKSVFAIDFYSTEGEGNRTFSLNSNSVFTYYYNQGYQSGLSASDTDITSYQSGYRLGFDKGYEKARNELSDYTFTGLIGAVIDAPITAVSGILNFEILGVNLLNFFFGILTIAIIVFVIRLFL